MAHEGTPEKAFNRRERRVFRGERREKSQIESLNKPQAGRESFLRATSGPCWFRHFKIHDHEGHEGSRRNAGERLQSSGEQLDDLADNLPAVYE
jgi:hypothetical protein